MGSSENISIYDRVVNLYEEIKPGEGFEPLTC